MEIQGALSEPSGVRTTVNERGALKNGSFSENGEFGRNHVSELTNGRQNEVRRERIRT